jgi:predicted PurR-regulated permease PerM
MFFATRLRRYPGKCDRSTAQKPEILSRMGQGRRDNRSRGQYLILADMLAICCSKSTPLSPLPWKGVLLEFTPAFPFANYFYGSAGRPCNSGIMEKIPNSIIRQVFHLALVVLIGGLLFWELRGFLPSFLGAYTLYILMRKPFIWLHARKNWPKPLAAIVLMLASIVVIVLPLNSVIRMLSARIIPKINNSNDIWGAVEQFVHELEARYQVEILTQEHIGNLGDFILRESSHLLGVTFNSVGLLAITYFLLYFLLSGGSRIENAFTSWLPLKLKNLNYFRDHLNKLVYANAIGIPLVSLFQSVVAAIGYWIAGVDDPFMWFIVTFFASFIPVLGAMVVYVPLSLMLFYNGAQAYAIFLLVYGLAVVGSVDNLFRMFLQKRIGDTHPLITIFGVLAGLKLFGFVGLIFGPILISLMLLLSDVYIKEYGEYSSK